MISGVNEAFQECSATSWYGEVKKKTYHLKRKLGLESAATFHPSSRKKKKQHTQRETHSERGRG